MTERSVNKVINCHWFGGIDKLPPNACYIGRPGPHGNLYSSASGKYIKDECVALHRVELYRTLVADPLSLAYLKHDLDHKDLACWCKQHKRVVGCHGDNYLHVLSPGLRDRAYDKSVLHYLMEDLRLSLKALHDRILHKEPVENYLFSAIHLEEVRLDINDVLSIVKEKYVAIEDLCNFIAMLVIDLELAYQETDHAFIRYRFDHVMWNIVRFIENRQDRKHEPISPHIPLKRKRKG